MGSAALRLFPWATTLLAGEVVTLAVAEGIAL